MMQKHPLSSSMGEAVIHRLQEFTPLPRKGYLAGQALASAVSELFGDGRAVRYNDVDVFREHTDEEIQSYRSRKEQGTLNERRSRVLDTCDFFGIDLEEHYQRISATAVRRYRVSSTRRRGLLNEVMCQFHTRDPLAFLDTFDMNCVQVGVDLESKTMFWTPHFEKFHRDRQLDIVTLHTPFQSLIRYFRKKEELEGVYGNDDRILEMLSAAYWIEHRRTEKYAERYGSRVSTSSLESGLQETTDMRWRFGQAYRTKLDAVGSQIFPHFEVETEVVNDYPVSRLVPRSLPGKDLLDVDLWCMPRTLPMVSRALREKHGKGKTERLHYLLNDTKTLKRRSWLLDKWFAYGDSFVQGNVSAAQMRQLDKTLSQHAIGEHVLASTLNEQWAKYQLIRDEAVKRGKWVYGVLENTHYPELGWTKETLSVELDAEAVRLSQQLKTHGLEPLLLNGYTIKELVTGIGLLDEGAELHHCVGGYAGAVEEGTSRIVSIRKGTSPSQWVTAQMALNKAGWHVVQLKGLLNRAATEEEAKVADQYASMMTLAYFMGNRLTCGLYRRWPDSMLAWARKLQGILKGRDGNRSAMYDGSWKIFFYPAWQMPCRKLSYVLSRKFDADLWVVVTSLRNKSSYLPTRPKYGRKSTAWINPIDHPIAYWWRVIQNRAELQWRKLCGTLPAPSPTTAPITKVTTGLPISYDMPEDIPF